jgi:glycosyltransferase involved in cell wall biosynthesis
LKIVMLAPFGIRPKGTLLARMLPLAQALVRRGHTLSIVAPPVQNPEDAGTRVMLDGVPVVHTPLPRVAGIAGAPEQAWLLLRAALAEQADVLHLFKPKGYGGLAALAARIVRPDLPLVVDSDDWEGWGGWNDLLPYPRLAKQLFAWQERDLPRRAAAVTVASRTLEQQVRGFGVPEEQIFFVPNGVSSSQFLVLSSQLRHQGRQTENLELNTQNLLLYTRFWEFDLRELVAALVGIAAGCPATRLVVVGRGERGEEHELLQLAARAGIAGMIDYRGWLAPDEIPAVLARCDIALAPLDDTLINRARGLAKLLELMAAGLPIVASRVGMAAEYLEDRVSGLLVTPGDPGALARAVLWLLHDPAGRERLRAGALARAECYRWDALAPAAEQAYEAARSRD